MMGMYTCVFDLPDFGLCGTNILLKKIIIIIIYI